jgi:hypothetical protein
MLSQETVVNSESGVKLHVKLAKLLISIFMTQIEISYLQSKREPKDVYNQ